MKADNTAEAPHSVLTNADGDADLLDSKFTALLPKLFWNLMRLERPTGGPPR